MTNLYTAFRELLPKTPLIVGQVITSAGGLVEVNLVGGGTMQAIGSGTPGSNVYIKDGTVQGPAPSYTVEIIDI